MKSYIDQLLALCDLAGRAVLEVYHGDNTAIRLKDDQSPVTFADYRSHQILSDGLTALTTLPVLSEESVSPPWHHRRQWREYWLIDPLDGTREFIKRNGEFTINVALIRDGEPVLGVVYAPVTQMFYYGSRGGGAFRQAGLDGKPIAIQCESAPEQRRWKVLASRSHATPDLAHFVSRLPAYEIISVGSSLKLCMVADGTADLYPRFGPTSEWDTAAAQAVVEAAGGQVLEWETLGPLRYNQKESLLNPSFIVCASVSKTWT